MYSQPAEKKAVQSEGIHSVALERHYSVPEVATLWGISEKTVRRLFDGEWWRRRESNPRPKMLLVKRLHAYSSSCPGHYPRTFAVDAQNGQETPAASLKISPSRPRRS